MSDNNDDGVVAIAKGIVAAVIIAGLAIKGCVVRQGLQDNLPLQLEDETVQEVPATNFSSDGRDAHLVRIEPSSDGTGSLFPGLNVIEMGCERRDSETYHVDLSGAHGELSVGTNVDWTGDRDDLEIERVNGEKVRVSLHCHTGKYSDASEVFVDVSR